MDDLLELILESFVKEGLVPRETPIQWVDRMLTELLLSGQRLSTHRTRKGNFDLVYLLAASADLDLAANEKRMHWGEYCRSIKYVPVQTKHNGMLDPEPAQLIAKIVDSFLESCTPYSH